MSIINFFKPKQSNFFKLLLDQAQKTAEGLVALETYMETGDQADADRVIDIEDEADELRLILIDELNRTFVTPIDREDIFSLSRAIDDVVDYARSTVEEMNTLGLQPNADLKAMTAVLREAGRELYLAVKEINDHPGVAVEHATRAKALENRAEKHYREAIAHLFKEPQTIQDLLYVLKMREVYRHLSNAADRGNETANIIGDIVVKMA
jgi:hypothetical protein